MRSSLALQRQLYEHQKRQIASLVHRPSAAFRRYEQRYERATSRYRRVIDAAQLRARIADSDVVYVGDYHTLGLAQHTFAELVETALDGGRRVVLALEFVEGTKQATLDAFLRGRLSERTFLARLGHLGQGGFEIWPGFRRILELARRHRLEVLAIDRRAGGSRSLERRDRYAAQRIARAAAAADRPLIFTLMGQFHVAPAHLPKEVTSALGRVERRGLVVYQNAEGVWWAVARRGLSGSARAVELHDGSLCLLTASPVVCQRSFLDYVEAEAGDSPIEPSGLARTFKLLSRSIARVLGLRVGREVEAIDVVTTSELEAMAAIAAKTGRSPAEFASRQSAFIPEARTVWLAGLSLSHAAEEAAMLVRWLALGKPPTDRRTGHEAFWAAAFEEALRLFGSRLVNPARPTRSIEAWVRLCRDAAASERRTAGRVLRLTAASIEGQARPALPSDRQARAALSQALGHLVGDALTRAFTQGQLPRADLRALFADPLPLPSAQFSALARRVLAPASDEARLPKAS